jgi:hypothetical protein
MNPKLPTEANLMTQAMFNNPVLLVILQLIKPHDSQLYMTYLVFTEKKITKFK